MMDKNEVARQRASFARDVEYIRCMTEDAEINDVITALDASAEFTAVESVDIDDKEIEDTLNQIQPDVSQKEDEIQRILQSDSDMTMDDIIGIADDEEHINDLENLDDLSDI